MRVSSSALVGLLVIASLIPLTQALEASRSPVLVWTPDAGAVAATGARVVESYDLFVLADATAAEVDVLRKAFDVEALPTAIVKGAVSFEPAQGDAPVADDLQSPDSAYLVVQLQGPIKAAWRSELLGFGDLMDYVPNNAFIVRAPGAADALRALPFVSFVAPYHAAYKLDPRLGAGAGMLDIAVWGGEDAGPVIERVQALGGSLDTWSIRSFESYLRVALDASFARDLARMEQVSWVEPFLMPEQPLDNANAAWVTQSGIEPGQPNGGASVHAKGLSGRGQVLAVGDTGLDSDSATAPTRLVHNAFSDPNVAFQFGVPNPTHRKVLAYLRLTEGGVVKGNYDDSGHGTHTSGSVSGDLATFGSYNGNDGQSFGGRHIIMDVEGTSFSVPVDYFNHFDPTYQLGARLHSNSFGGSHNLAYTLPARQNDEYTYTHQDFLIFRSMGNTCPSNCNSIRPEAVAKNVISSGATENGQGFNNIASFSSRGPTQDGRVKPTVVAPGAGVTSTCVGNVYCSMSGTSMSTPTTAGASGLVRQYFQEGWHGGNGQGSAAPFNPSAALVRGVLINSAFIMDGAGTSRPGLANGPLDVVGLGCPVAGICPGKALGANWPNGDQGWGLVRLDDALKFSGDAGGLFVADGASVGTGSQLTYTVNVAGEEGLKVTLAWSDAPATAGANPALVNDLDLVVVLPSGIEVKGNVFLGPNTGLNHPLVTSLTAGLVPSLPIPVMSVPGGAHDRRNVEEVVTLPDAAAGTYTIRVAGANVPSGSQAFALVASGGL